MILEDKRIVELYWERSETAIAATAKKYGRYCHYIAHNILLDEGESEECVNDTYLNAWNAMPPHRPQKLAPFLGKITRNLALNRRAEQTAQKRGGGQYVLALDELGECIPDRAAGGDVTEEILLRQAINRFLRELPEETMIVFLQRYWYFASIRDIARNRNMSEGNVKVMLHRAREKFKLLLEKEGLIL